MRRSLAPSTLNSKDQSSNFSIVKTNQFRNTEKSQSDSSSFAKFTVLYGKLQTRKHKVFSDDGFLEIRGKKAILKDENEKVRLNVNKLIFSIVVSEQIETN